MTLLDRAIARQFLTNALALLVILFTFVVAIDVSLNFGQFARMASDRAAASLAAPTAPITPTTTPAASPASKAAPKAAPAKAPEPKAEASSAPATPAKPGLVRVAGSFVYLVVDLWWPRLVQLFNSILGLVLVGALGFTAAQLVKNRELTAILASGLSLHRVARPMLVASGLLLGVQAVNQEVLIPSIAPLLTREHDDAGQKQLGRSSLALTTDAKGRLFYAAAFDADKGTVEDLYVWERDAAGLPVRRIYAPKATWKDGRWELQQGLAQRLITDRPVAAEKVAALETDLGPTAMTMRRFAGFAGNLSWSQIGQMLSAPAALDATTRQRLSDLERIRWSRPAVLLCNFLGLLIALPFFLRREPANMVLQSVKAAPLAIGAVVGGAFGAAVVIPGLPAQLSVFVPVMVLTPFAIAAVTSIKT
ncbi:MAG: LptF/LptG family permease [Planctomycetota bacterium]|nr:LptF/LptG family permease [Planctomycetota bacterium]